MVLFSLVDSLQFMHYLYIVHLEVKNINQPTHSLVVVSIVTPVPSEIDRSS
jgi:hypothetical protein